MFYEVYCILSTGLHMHKIVLLLFLLVANLAYGAPVIYENQPVERIDIKINLPSGEGGDDLGVRSKIKTKEGSLFSQAEFDNDLKNLSQQYDRVEPSIQICDGKLVIALKLWPKPTIRSINFEGNCKKTTQRLMKELKITVCSVFDRKEFNQAFHNLKTYYVKKGFFEAELDYTVTLDSCTNEVDILITVNEGRSGKIKEIKFCGFEPCEEDEILTKMVTKEYVWYKSWMTEEGTYREDAIQHDQFQVQQYLQNKGYADAQVKIEIEEVGCDRIIVHVLATRGELYSICKIRFEGNCLFDDDQILSKFKVCPGAPFSPENIRETVSAIQDLYGKFGYIDCYVSFEPKLECERNYSLSFTIEEGDQFRVGLIKVFGNCHTQTNVILHETLLIPGEIFNTEKLKLTEKRLMNIGYFKKVNVYAVKTDEGSALPGCYRDVHIEVEETSTGKFGLFAGFSTSDSVFGGATLSENNFNIMGLGTCWKRGFRTLRGGGEYLNISAQVGQKSREYALSWTKPYFMDTKWSIGFDIDNSFNHYYSDDFTISAVGLVVRAGRQLNPFVRFQWHYRIRDSHVDTDAHIKRTEKKIENIQNDTNLSPAQKAIDINNALEDSNQSIQSLQLDKRDGLVSATGVSFTYDTTDNPVKTRKGYKSIFEAEIAGLGGNYTFLGFAYLNTYLFPMTSKSAIKYRWDFRFLVPFGATDFNRMPLDERLYMGGNNFVRGYRPYRLGPIFPNSQIPEGGISMQLYSAEYNYEFNERFEGFLFADAGHLSTSKFSLLDQGVRGSLGLGLRISVLESLPPITLGYGFPLYWKKRSEVKQFFIQFGAKF